LVGNHLRDWETSTAVVRTLLTLGIEAVVVARPEHLARFPNDPRVSRIHGVSERQLRSLYDESAAVLLAVKDATASNTLLEAMAAGCPVISSRLPSLIHEYAGDGKDSFVVNSPLEAVTRLLAYLEDPRRRFERSRTLMSRALTFDWLHLTAQYRAAYEEVVERLWWGPARRPNISEYPVPRKYPSSRSSRPSLFNRSNIAPLPSP
jgi:glycosyltransferase involved in cell wall biosynthesis